MINNIAHHTFLKYENKIMKLKNDFGKFVYIDHRRIVTI